MILHLFAHCDKNLVKKGDRVKKYETLIGTVGDGNGQYWAHLHFSISDGLSVEDLVKYVGGWSKEKVERYYKNPKNIDFKKMFGFGVDVGNMGYDFLQKVPGVGFHPGVDVNGYSGGNSDIGYKFKSSCDGVVVYEVRTWFKNGGWGNIVICREDETPVCNHKCPKCCK